MKKVVPKLRQEVKVDIVTSDDIKIYYTGKFQDFTARYIINYVLDRSRSAMYHAISSILQEHGSNIFKLKPQLAVTSKFSFF